MIADGTSETISRHLLPPHSSSQGGTEDCLGSYSLAFRSSHSCTELGNDGRFQIGRRVIRQHTYQSAASLQSRGRCQRNMARAGNVFGYQGYAFRQVQCVKSIDKQIFIYTCIYMYMYINIKRTA